MGDVEGAAGLLSEALQLAADASAPKCIAWVRTCCDQWLTDGALPAVHRLDEQMLALTPQSPQ